MLPFFVQAPITLQIDLAKPGVAISPTLYGLMTEEINYSYDGGLYGELVRNRAFLDDPKKPTHWTAVGDGATVELGQGGPSAARPMTLRFQGGVANDGYWGIPVKPGSSLRLSLWAKADGAGPISADIESSDGRTVYAKAMVNGTGGDWRKLSVTLTTGKDITAVNDGRLVLRSKAGRSVWLAQVSLFPPTYRGRVNGNRPDLMEKLVGMRPKFLRFPGGNYLEGNTLAERFPWEATLGPIEERPGHRSPWGYRSTDGMGLLEFLTWCEDMKAKPVLAVYAGLALNGDHLNPGPDLQPSVQSALDEIQYVIGGPETPWGARRAKDGHPKPFPLECIEIGNEDGFDKSNSYQARFVQFYDAIRAKYPSLKLISTTGGKDYLGLKFPITERTPDLWDEHYYSDAWDMMAMATKYDDYDRKGPKVFVGEWASFDTVAPWKAKPGAPPTPNVRSMLGDAAFMTGLERNSDIVRMACYAPLFVNVNPGGHQWVPDLIGYDNLNSYGSPSYTMQKLFSENLGDQTVPFALAGVPNQIHEGKSLPGIFASATRDTKTGALYIKLVNALPTDEAVSLQFAGGKIGPGGMVTTLGSSDLKAINSLGEPNKVAPVRSKLSGLGSSFERTLPAQTVTVLQLTGRGQHS